jgi:hypothetical protein
MGVEQVLLDFLDLLNKKRAQQPSGCPKRRRLGRNRSSTTGELVTQQVQYSDPVDSGRRFAKGVASQTLPRRCQKHVLHHTKGLDIANAVFTIVAQLVQRLGLQDSGLFATELATLEKWAKHRDSFIIEELQTDKQSGKNSSSRYWEANALSVLKRTTLLCESWRISLACCAGWPARRCRTPWLGWLARARVGRKFLRFQYGGKNARTEAIASAVDCIRLTACQYARLGVMRERPFLFIVGRRFVFAPQLPVSQVLSFRR